ncbi:MAG: flagellar biosynthesis protein [Armatimonadetes bacterium]|nr:flagellar biosynthesis protein [Armatimonadota bacterium]
MRLDRIDKAGAIAGATEAQAPRKTGAVAFEEALRKATGSESTTAAPGLDFSKHALQRLEQRGIKLDDQLMERLTGAVDRAATKGSRTTLVLVDQTAFVVGVPNRTVVTVADQENLREKVFTNIDSMVIA